VHLGGGGGMEVHWKNIHDLARRPGGTVPRGETGVRTTRHLEQLCLWKFRGGCVVGPSEVRKVAFKRGVIQPQRSVLSGEGGTKEGRSETFPRKKIWAHI